MTMTEFSPAHHALMFAYLAREVMQRTGIAEGEAVLRAAIRHYGEQRGRRMALRVRRDKRTPTMAHFLVYSEWRAPADAIDSDMTEREDAVVQCVRQCPWADAWTAHDLRDEGKLYCTEIDTALVRGFNPHLQVEVLNTQTNSAGPCQFVFHDALPATAFCPDPATTVLPWDYHTAHLYFAFSSVICAALGEAGEAAVDAALEAFAVQFGQDARQAVLHYAGPDFNALPD